MVEGGSRVEKTLELAVPFGSPASFDGKYKHIDVAYYLVTEVRILRAVHYLDFIFFV